MRLAVQALTPLLRAPHPVAQVTCNTVEPASSIDALAEVLHQHLSFTDAESRPQYIFFDIDECLVMPATPFIDGLPGSDALNRKLDALCGDDIRRVLRQRMVEAYYRAPLKLVDPGLPALISDVQARGVRIHGLTSRGSQRDQWEYAWHNTQVIDALARHGVRFSTLDVEHVGSHGFNTPAGGILYCGGDPAADKAAVMQHVTGGDPATLVDNSASKLCKATALGRACVHGVHFTAAWGREASDAERRRWIYLQDLGFDRSNFSA